MSDTNTIHVSAFIDNTPEAVMDYVAEPIHRPLYLRMLKSVSDVDGDPRQPGTTWKWVWTTYGMEFEGTARCVEYEPGTRYVFRSESGIDSTWVYNARPEGEGTRLMVEVEYTVPEHAISRLPGESTREAQRQAAVDEAIRNLKTILDR